MTSTTSLSVAEYILDSLDGLYAPILGDVGAGKTAFMTWVGYQAALRGELVVTNYPVAYPHLEVDFNNIRHLLDPDMGDFRKKLLGARVHLDEMHEGADAYDFAAKWARALHHVVAQRRHLEISLLSTDQRGSQIMKRNRLIGDRWILVTDLDKRENISLRPNPDRPHKAFKNCAGISRVEILDEDWELLDSIIFESKEVWNLYDSHFIISDANRVAIDESGEE